jgi:integrase
MVDAPRVNGQEVEIMTPARIGSVLAALRGKPSHPIVAVMLVTGLRRSEAFALRWQDLAGC